MEPEAYIRKLAAAVTRQEDETASATRRDLEELAYRIRALLLALPESALGRQLEYSRLRPRIYREIQYTVTRLRPLILSALEPIEAATLRISAAFFDIPALPARSLADLLADTRVALQNLNTILLPRASSGLSDLTLQLYNLLDKSIRAALLRNESSLELANRVVQTRTRRGRTSAVITKGTVANAWRSRLNGVVAAALWTLAYANQQRSAVRSGRRIEEWRWNAVLDPKTCPVCRPLDGTTAPFPDAFLQGPPPLHPFCRCVVIPMFTD
jgi:SPP1 gp7 family putative phage head morphogenesis protein